jgi:Ca2+-binding EF-hand superfamily protein
MWKDFNELEENISMPELASILEAKRKQDYEEKKFMAALQGVDLDKTSRKTDDALQGVIQRAKERIGANTSTPVVDSNDITSLRGKAAQQAGFGIGMGLDYEVI